MRKGRQAKGWEVRAVAGAPTVRAVVGALVVIALFGATEASASPVAERPQIVDVAGDANFLVNEHLSLPAQASDHGDILKAWFTHTDKTITAHVLTVADPQDSPFGMNIQVWANPPGAPRPDRSVSTWSGCYAFGAGVPGTLGTGQGPVARFADHCNRPGLELPATVRWTEAEGGFVGSITIRRASTPAFAKAATLVDPYALSRPVVIGPVIGYRGDLLLDLTPFGTPYRLR